MALDCFSFPFQIDSQTQKSTLSSRPMVVSSVPWSSRNLRGLLPARVGGGKHSSYGRLFFMRQTQRVSVPSIHPSFLRPFLPRGADPRSRVGGQTKKAPSVLAEWNTHIPPRATAITGGEQMQVMAKSWCGRIGGIGVVVWIAMQQTKTMVCHLHSDELHNALIPGRRARS
ncbi:hypothetical protein CONLIGDRAFT_371385 [Coniochaeta ligniaria NRRL 30616]|uniref:Uncharacterized protein n=1 Tax=Coniochaeta ligniaria NRRL 30616 TaxID=1408157 RepID=A0A1J7IM09_9PEZI|nr:hypothetical protein CONLIGDRAFT_371385 [Coniochaeta ligniaria NRRL 30616]